jgi:hypothetical protein
MLVICSISWRKLTQLAINKVSITQFLPNPIPFIKLIFPLNREYAISFSISGKHAQLSLVRGVFLMASVCCRAYFRIQAVKAAIYSCIVSIFSLFKSLYCSYSFNCEKLIVESYWLSPLLQVLLWWGFFVHHHVGIVVKSVTSIF